MCFIQPRVDYACSVWYPNLNKKFKTKLQTLQNKCVRFCLQFIVKPVGITEFKQIISFLLIVDLDNVSLTGKCV